MNKIKVIISKEWSEVFKNRLVFFTTLFLPLLFTALPLIVLGATRGAVESDLGGGLPEQFTALCPAGLSGGECFQVYLVSQMLVLFMLMPLIIPINIAAYSIAGEKTNRSLEPLLATPITTTQLLIGKNLAAVIPAVAATWIGFLVFAIGTFIMVRNPLLLRTLLDIKWLTAVLVAGPLLAVLSVNFAMMVSSRATDPRVAEQLSAVVILPVMLIFFGQVSGFLILNNALVVVLVAVLALLDTGMIFLTVRIFEREHILTRWK